MNVNMILRGKGDRVVTVRPDDTVGTAAKRLADERIGAVLVTGADGTMCGVLSERDIVRGIGGEGAAALAQPVSSLMTADVVRCAPGDSVNGVMARMSERRIRHLPVFDGDKLLGIVSIGDVVKHRIQEIEAEASALRDYIST
ncbi:MAG: CBS domain-containing protein [Planctomycetes bacterium]|nr:CBS domain-containing protein [Planctomycetota bacterium]